jgi:hypothetical protein
MNSVVKQGSHSTRINLVSTEVRGREDNWMIRTSRTEQGALPLFIQPPAAFLSPSPRELSRELSGESLWELSGNFSRGLPGECGASWVRVPLTRVHLRRVPLLRVECSWEPGNEGVNSPWPVLVGEYATGEGRVFNNAPQTLTRACGLQSPRAQLSSPVCKSCTSPPFIPALQLAPLSAIIALFHPTARGHGGPRATKLRNFNPIIHHSAI